MAPGILFQEETQMRRNGSRAVKWMVAAAVTAMLSPVSMSFAAVLNDEVTSQKLKEADGTSGQDTNSGSGVKTGHIQNGAVTDAKIAGTISTSKLNVGTSAGTVAAGDHNHDNSYQKKYAQTIVVAKSGGDFTDLFTALSSITDASASKPYLVKVMPGVYNLAVPPNSVQIFDYITVQGSGRDATKLSCVSDGNWSSYRPCISIPCSNCGISDLTVEMHGNASLSRDAVVFHVAFSPNLHNLNIIAQDGANDIGIQIFGVDNAVVEDVNIYTNGQGMYSFNYYSRTGQMLVDNLRIGGVAGSTPATGITVTDPGATFIVKNSEISGGITAPSGSAKIAHSRLNGTVGGNVKVVNCYDQNYNALPNQ